MRATGSPLLTTLPRSTETSASRPTIFVPSTICSSAARVPLAVTVRATLVSAAGTRRTVRAEAVAAASDFFVDAVAGSSCWQPAVTIHVERARKMTRRPPGRIGRALTISGPRAARRAGGRGWTTLDGRIGYPRRLRQRSPVTESEDLQVLHQVAQVVVGKLLGRPGLLHVLPHGLDGLLERRVPAVVEVGRRSPDASERGDLELTARPDVLHVLLLEVRRFVAGLAPGLHHEDLVAALGGRGGRVG